MIQPVAHIAGLAPYALAELDVPEGKSLISLSQNESLRPPSPMAIEAAAKALACAALYPDPDWTQLRRALATRFGVRAEGILCANGSMELIAAIARVFADETGSVLVPAHAYPFFRNAAALARAAVVSVPEKEGRVSVDALLQAANPATRLVFVANPGNPTGTRLSRQEIEHLRQGLRRDILLVIDEAYGEFADPLKEPMFDLVTAGNTILLRTFSKAYGLAGLRVGWGLFPDALALEMHKVLTPNALSGVAQAAACGALADAAYMQETCRLTQDLRSDFTARLNALGFAVAESFTNFVLIPFASAGAAANADAALRAEGVFLRGQAAAGLPECLRVTIGPAPQMTRVVEILQRWKEQQ